jgi:hypothetical protein
MNMKKIASAVFLALVLGVGVCSLLLFRAKSSNRQQLSESGPQAAIARKSLAASLASSEEVQTANGAEPSVNTSTSAASSVATLPTPSQPAGSSEASAVEVIAGDVEAEKDVFKEPYIKRSRPIAISRQIIEKAGKLVPGSRLKLDLFSDAHYGVTLQVVNRSPQGDLSVSGRLDGQEYGTFVLSTAGDVVLAKLADPPAAKLFLIRCHGPTHTHYAVEVDVGKTRAPKSISNNAVLQ